MPISSATDTFCRYKFKSDGEIGIAPWYWLNETSFDINSHELGPSMFPLHRETFAPSVKQPFTNEYVLSVYIHRWIYVFLYTIIHIKYKNSTHVCLFIASKIPNSCYNIRIILCNPDLYLFELTKPSSRFGILTMFVRF